MRRRSAGVSRNQRTISSTVRPHPSQSPLGWSIMQRLTQGVSIGAGSSFRMSEI
jgi:hypothetical protein